MAAVVFTRVASQLQQLLSPRKQPLKPRDLEFLDVLVSMQAQPSVHVSSDLYLCTQIASKLGLLFKQVLRQHQVHNKAGWQHPRYCCVVQKAALALAAVCLTAADSAGNVTLIVAQQLQSSGILPPLIAALQQLAPIVGDPQQMSNALDSVADSMLSLVTAITAVWPGEAGLLNSRAAGGIAAPALELAAAYMWHRMTCAALNASIFSRSLGVTSVLLSKVCAQGMLVKDKQIAGQLQDWQEVLLHSLHRSPGLLQLLLTVLAFGLGPGSVQKISSSTQLADAPASAVGTSATVNSAAKHATAATAAATAATAAQPAASGSGTPIAGVDHGAAAPSVPGPAYSGGVNITTAADPAAAALCTQQQVLLLRALYPQIRVSSSDKLQHLLCNAQSALASSGWYANEKLVALLRTADCCVQCINVFMSSAQHQGGAQVSSLDYFINAQAGNLDALQSLPALLLRALPPTAHSYSPTAMLMHETARLLVMHIVSCWYLRISRHLAGRVHGIEQQQLPVGEVLGLVLQHIRSLQQQKAQAAAAAALAATASKGSMAATVDVDQGRDVEHNSSTSCCSYPAQAAAAPAVSTATANADQAAAYATAAVHNCLMLISKLAEIPAYVAWQPVAAEISPVFEEYLRLSSSTTAASSSSCSSSRGRIGDMPAASDPDDTHIMLMDCESLLVSRRPGADLEVADAVGPLPVSAAASQTGSAEQRRLLTLLLSILKQSTCVMVVKQRALIRGSDRLRPNAVEDSAWLSVHTAAQHMLNALAGTTTATSSSSSGSSSNGSSSSSSNGDGSQVPVAAAAPWLVVLARLLLNTAGWLEACLEYDPPSPPEDPVPGHLATETQHLAKRLELYVYLANLVRWSSALVITATVLVRAILRCSRHAAAVVAGSSSSTTINRSSTPLVADAAHAVLAQQTLALCHAQQLLETAVIPKLEALEELAPAVDKLPKVNLDAKQLEGQLAGGQLDEAGIRAAKALLQCTDGPSQYKPVLLDWGISELLQQLREVGSCVCAALPHTCYCSNPFCTELSGASEWGPVSGKACVCARCQLARYCSKACQASHWQQHKAICRAIAKQNL